MESINTTGGIIVGPYVSYPLATPEPLQEAISEAVYSRKFARVWYGDTASGRIDAPPSCMVEGIIKRMPHHSGLPMIVPKGERIGPALETRRIVRLALLTRKKTPPALFDKGVEIATVMTAEGAYEHRSFSSGAWSLEVVDKEGVFVNWNSQPVKRFTTREAAYRWMSVHRGDSYLLGPEHDAVQARINVPP